MSEVEGKLKEIVAEQLDVEESSITAEANFAADLGADSLDVVSSRALSRAPASRSPRGLRAGGERGEGVLGARRARDLLRAVAARSRRREE